MINKKVQTLTELEDYLIRVVSAYRRSYKLLGNIDKVVSVTTGIVSSSAILALVPAIPIAIAGLGTIPVITTVFRRVIKISARKTNLKLHHRKFKELLSYVKALTDETESDKVI